MIRRIFVLAANDWRLTLRDRQALLWMLLMPVLFTFVFGTAFRGSDGERERGSIPVVLEDPRFLGAAVLRGMEDANWAPERTARGDSSFARLGEWVEIPAGFTDSVLALEGSTIRVMHRGGGSAERRQAHLVSAWKAAIRALAVLHDVPDSLFSLPDERLAPLYDSLAARPDLVTLSVRDAAGIRKRPRGFLLSVPGNLVMFVLIVALTSGAANVASDVSSGQLRRLGASPLGRGEIFAGKLLGNALVAITQIAVLVAATTLLFRVRWGADPLALALLFLAFALVASSIGVFLGLSVRKPETAAAAGVLITLVMAALGGCWWPLEIVSEGMRRAGHIFPTAWALDGIFGLMAYEQGLAGIAKELLVLAGYALAFGLAGARLLRFDR